MVIFSTVGGTTRKVAKRIAARIGDTVCVDAQTARATPPASDDSCVVLLCPAYGDEELEDHFESLLLEWNWSALSGNSFAFCEIGIYTGYEDFGHGLARMVRQKLHAHGLRELVPPLSVDAVPISDWAMIDAWADLLVRPSGVIDE